MTDEEILNLIKGELATSVKLEVLRGIDLFNVKVMREVIVIPTVTSKLIK